MASIQSKVHELNEDDFDLRTAAYQPEFAEPIVNLSVPVGRDATFRCLVHHLGGYRVSSISPINIVLRLNVHFLFSVSSFSLQLCNYISDLNSE
ncbi:hypothetical protein NQ317_012477 [Molorchus minor]|uniref:Uncharacterized protein n=1 Tax=Molorchus minor TaxID=1323400 RepID=A0ABQ9K3H6_9CUCU|nr:hypothetical protein NQ317_012477 [Molorchus minor]